MYKDPHINQVSFTTRRRPTKYLRYDIHHVDDMKPWNAYSRTEIHPLQTLTPHPHYIPAIQHPIPPREPIQPLETIPAPTDGKSAKHAVYLNSQRRAMRYWCPGWPAPFPSSWISLSESTLHRIHPADWSTPNTLGIWQPTLVDVAKR